MRIVAVLMFGVALVANALAVWLPLNDRTTGELSAQYPNLFVPAGITFSIWSVIYLLLAAWSVAQFAGDRPALAERIAPAWAISSALNAAWIFAWHYELVALSVLIMLGLLAALLAINAILAEHGGGRWLPRATFGVYLGWICVATIANVTTLFVDLRWDGGGIPDAVWAMILVVVGAAAGSFALLRLNNPYVGAAVAWAFAGIVLNRWDDYRAIAFTAIAMAALVGTLALGSAYTRSAGTSAHGRA
jgi:hypothetical protein